MSSHHFVREAQEPALLLVGPGVSYATLAQLLEWVPTVLVCPPALEWALALGIKMDGVVAPPTLLAEWGPRLAHQQPLLQLPAAQNPEATALRHLWQTGHQAVNVVGPWSPPLWPPQWNAWATEGPLVLYAPGWRGIWAVGQYAKWVAAGTLFWCAGDQPQAGLQPAPGGQWLAPQPGWVRWHLAQPKWLWQSLPGPS
ncbi:MAG: hypothetical protein MUC97_18940 [Bernardetiaceae bacterium]|nr:hypothetical protein [Bernardetiaceae bacterium]